MNSWNSNFIILYTQYFHLSVYIGIMMFFMDSHTMRFKNITINIFHGSRKWIYFILIVLGYQLILFLLQKLIADGDVYFRSYGEQIASERIDEILQFQKKWLWIGYVIIPIVLLLKCLSISACLSIGAIFKDLDLKFSQLFKIVLLGDFIFIGDGVIRLVWFYFNSDLLSITYISSFSPLSILNFFDSQSIQPIFIYPLQLINVFEVAYWIFLTYGLSVILQKKFGEMLELVAVYYGGGLLIWVITIMFLSVSFT